MKKLFLVGLAMLIAASTVSADTSFLRALVDKPSTSFGDGVYMLVHFMGKGQEYPAFEEGKRFLEEKGVLKGALRQKPAEGALQRGELAEMAITALDVRGGVAMRIANAAGRNGRLSQGVYRRYALKEMVFLQLMVNGDSHADVSGQELISVISRMETYQEELGATS